MSKLLDYPLTEAKPEIVDGERSQEAIVMQEAKEGVVNTITVDEVKELDKKNDSKQDLDLEELKKASQNKVTIHEFDEGTILTDKILSEVKTGDIVKVLQMGFIVSNIESMSPRLITGKTLGAVTESSLTVINLDWFKGQALEPTLQTIIFSAPGGSQPAEPAEPAAPGEE